MASTSSAAGAGNAIEISRVFAAPRARVWQAWTQPEQLARWLCRTAPGVEVRVTRFDFRVVGGFSLEAQAPGGPLYQLDCEYREIREPAALVFTWKWRGEEEETLVSVEFREIQAGQTEVRLRHARFASEKSREGHAWGWNACFDKLEKALM